MVKDQGDAILKKRRFYKQTGIVEKDGMFLPALDGRVLKTPTGAALCLGARPLAEAIAQEWQDQGDIIRPHTMPLMQLAGTAIDRIAPRQSEVVAELVRHAETDLLCYRADEPADLAERQARFWQPITDWATARFDVGFVIVSGLMPASQPAATLERLGAWLGARDAFRLAGIHLASASMGSLLLAIALAEGRLSADEAFAASQLDETFQIERWGEDEEASRRRAVLRGDVAAAHRLLTLLGPA